jgi:hypothetical protein
MLKRLLRILYEIIKVPLGIVKAVSIILTVLSVPLVVLLIYWHVTAYYDSYYSAKFDKQLWAENNDRCAMYGDLKKNYLKKGMTKEAVEQLLGKRNSYYYCLDKKIKCTSYKLGLCTPIQFIGSCWIDICFNEDQRVLDFNKSDLANKICKSDDNIASCDVSHLEKPCQCYKDTPITDLGTVNTPYVCNVEKW